MGWRTYEAADKCAVDALHIEMQARLGQTFELPDLSKRPILVSLVYEKDGVITHAAALEAEAELMVLGNGPLPTNDFKEADRVLTGVCSAYRIRMVRALVPNSALQSKRQNKLAPVARILKRFGFRRESPDAITSFTRWMGGKE